MKDLRQFRMLRARWLWFGGLFGVLCLNAPVTSAQSSVTITVEDTHGNAVPNVKVMGRRVEKEKGKEETLALEVLTPSKSEGKTYTISGLAKGKYKFYACEPDLKFEPDYKEIGLGDGESKKFPLILQEQETTQPVDDPDFTPGKKVCLVHEDTGCHVIKVIEPSGEIKYAGVRNHYHVEEPDACKKN